MLTIPVGGLCTAAQCRASLPAAVRSLVTRFGASSVITLPVQWGDQDAFQQYVKTLLSMYCMLVRDTHPRHSCHIMLVTHTPAPLASPMSSLNNVTMLRYFESARMAHFQHVIAAQMSPTAFQALSKGHGIAPIVKSLTCTYRAQVRYPDTLTLCTRVPLDTVREDRFEMRFEAVSHRLERVVADGAALVVMFDYGKDGKAPVPKEMLDALRAADVEDEKLREEWRNVRLSGGGNAVADGNSNRTSKL